MARVFPQTQRFESPIFFDKLPTHAREPRSYLLMIAWLQIFGIDWVVGRAFFFFVGLLLLGVIYGLCRWQYGALGGLYASTLTSTTLIFFVTAHQMRLDIMFALAVAVILVVNRYADTHNDWRFHFLTGFLLVFSYEAHANAIALIPAFGVFYLFSYARATWKYRRYSPWALVPGGVVGTLVFLLLHVAPSVSDFTHSFTFTLGERGFPLFSTLPVSNVLLNYLTSGLVLYFRDSVPEVVLSGLLVLVGLLNKRTRKFALLYVLFLCFSIPLIATYRPVYFINGIPFLALIAAGLLVQQPLTTHKLTFATLILVVLGVSTGFQVVPAALENWNLRLLTNIKQLSSDIPAGSTVISSPIMLLGLGFDRNVIDQSTVIAFSKQNSLDELLVKLDPQYIVVFPGETPRFSLREYGSIDTSKQYLPVESHIESQAFYPGVNGQIEVYKLREFSK